MQNCADNDAKKMQNFGCFD